MAFSTLNTPTALSPDDADELRTTAKWARLVAILGFVFLGLMLLVGVFYALILTRSMGAFMKTGMATPYDPAVASMAVVAVLLFFAIIYFFPLLFLYRYATRTLKSLSGAWDPAAFSSAVRSHRSFYAYLAILAVVAVLIYAITVVALAVAYFYMRSRMG